jgi:hypothetical protein
MEDLIKTLGMQLAGDARIQAQLRQAISQGIGAVIVLIKPAILSLLPTLGGVALILAPVLVPVLILGVATWLIAECA